MLQPEMPDRSLDERDELILRSTEELIAEQGYDRVRLIDIADRSGVSIGSLQHRFRSKEGLLRATAERVASLEAPSAVDRSAAKAEPLEGLMAMLRPPLLVDPNGPSSLLWLQLVVVSARDPELNEVLRRADAVWRAAFQEALGDSLADGRLRSDFDARQISNILVAMVDGFVIQRVLDTDTPDPEGLVDLSLAVLRKLVEVD